MFCFVRYSSELDKQKATSKEYAYPLKSLSSQFSGAKFDENSLKIKVSDRNRVVEE